MTLFVYFLLGIAYSITPTPTGALTVLHSLKVPSFPMAAVHTRFKVDSSPALIFNALSSVTPVKMSSLKRRSPYSISKHERRILFGLPGRLIFNERSVKSAVQDRRSLISCPYLKTLLRLSTRVSMFRRKMPSLISNVSPHSMASTLSWIIGITSILMSTVIHKRSTEENISSNRKKVLNLGGVKVGCLRRKSDEESFTPKIFKSSYSTEDNFKSIMHNLLSTRFKFTHLEHEKSLKSKSSETVCGPALTSNSGHGSATSDKKKSQVHNQITDSQIVPFKDGVITVKEGDHLSYSHQESDINIADSETILDAPLKKAYNFAATEENVEQQIQWMESEVRAASIGGHEILPFHAASAVTSSVAAHIWAATEVAGEDKTWNNGFIVGFYAALVNVTSKVAEMFERMILEEDIPLDIAFIEQRE